MKKHYTNLISLKTSNSIKLQVPTKIFPNDFFQRSSSMSPNKSKQQTRMINSPILKRNLSMESAKRSTENGLYWGIMKNEIDDCLEKRNKERKLPLQRIWVLQKQEQRIKVQQNKNNEGSDTKIVKRKSFLGIKYKKLTVPKQIKQEKGVMDEGLFTFYGKIPKSALNRHLSPLT